MDRLTLVKLGGAQLKDGPDLEALVDVLARLAAERQLILVHGGGPEIAELQKRLGVEPRYLDGLRCTDEESLWVAEMVLSGSVNKRLTARLVNRGVKAIGLSGVDGGLLRAVRMTCPKGDLGHVGEITDVDVSLLSKLLGDGFTPIVSPISLGADGRSLNVNADHAALAIASALRVDEIVFLTDVPGVIDAGVLLEELDADQARRLIDAGGVTGGMIPKVRSALRAIESGVRAARITGLSELADGGGTRLLASSPGQSTLAGEKGKNRNVH